MHNSELILCFFFLHITPPCQTHKHKLTHLIALFCGSTLKREAVLPVWVVAYLIDVYSCFDKVWTAVLFIYLRLFFVI